MTLISSPARNLTRVHLNKAKAKATVPLKMATIKPFKSLGSLKFLQQFLSIVTLGVIFVICGSLPRTVLSSSSTTPSVTSSVHTTETAVEKSAMIVEREVSVSGDNDRGDTNSVKKIVYLADMNSQYFDVKVHEKSSYNVDASVGYQMPDIKVHSSAGIQLKDLNAFVPTWRAQTQYQPGQRRYKTAYRAAVLEVPNAYAYTYGEDFVIADARNVYNIGGCGERMEGWDLRLDGDRGQVWEAPIQTVIRHHRFKSLAVLVHRFSDSYFHWITESLPRLMLYFETLTSEQQRSIRYLVNRERYVRESLRLFGVYDNRQLIFYDPQSVYQAGTIYVAAGTPCGKSPRPMMNLLQKRFHNVLFPSKKYARLPRPPNDKKSAPGLTVLIKRNYSRQMSNIDDVKKTLRKHLKKGQEIILFDDVKPQSLISQYMIFNKAQMILGTHGGGLANILWSTIGTKVIEVLPVTSAKDGRRARVCYASIAGSLGMDYRMIPVENEEFDDPVEVPLDDLTAAIISE